MMKTTKNRILAALGALALVGAMGLAFPSAASAATSCSGVHVKTLKIKNPSTGVIIGKLGVYDWGSRVCAVLMKSGPTYGVATDTGLFAAGDGRMKKDVGRFKFQTDALTVARDSSGCVLLHGVVEGKNGDIGTTTWDYCSHSVRV